MSYQDLAEQSAICARRIMSLEGDLAAAQARNIQLIADLGIKDARIEQLERQLKVHQVGCRCPECDPDYNDPRGEYCGP